MFFNPIIFPAIIIGTVLFFIGQRVGKKVKGKPVRILLGLLFTFINSFITTAGWELFCLIKLKIIYNFI
jgi:hypothetical protein